MGLQASAVSNKLWTVTGKEGIAPKTKKEKEKKNSWVY